MRPPEAFLEKMQALLGAAFGSFLAEYEKPPLRGLRRNALKLSPALDAALRGWEPAEWNEALLFVPEGRRPGLWPEQAAGLYYLQEPSASLPVGALGVRPGMRVLDLCAAPGGKSTQIAEALAGEGILVANEVHAGRARILLENIERQGVANAVVLNESPQRLAAHFGPWFDAVLVDAPCSGEGMFRRDDEAIAQWSERALRGCHERQLEILLEAAKLLRPGGRLVYSTCTFNTLENEGSVEAFLCARPEFSLIGAERAMPHTHRGEGQFYAVFTKQGGEGERRLPALGAAGPDERFSRFAGEALNESPFWRETRPQGDWLYALPGGMPELKGLRVLRAGLQLGRLLPKRFEPAHALALCAKRGIFQQEKVLLPEEALLYLRGEALEAHFLGWGTVTLGGWPLGLAKGAEGRLQNHYPKGLRREGLRACP
jgi:16S rRNA C967 or C1407 C5-methylase (RsmB/RsmF family)/NOL1/NOP2/fmu family ribosome biogenesis protein